ncbi:UPF0481 protein At3g47200-like isoform X3 [Solanum dulcamara]|uniref:UPF0481 protein At3g47200-like isoform X3 n=1 Tax=Solanum dulcamara TaxID=45834 RepID=UPI00248573E5|nr:UPF0481 protein At3g47200-like isoform X3 [Solanum dulcamara]
MFTHLLEFFNLNRIEEGGKVDHLIDIEETKKCVNQIFDKMFEDLDNLSIKSCTIFKVNVGLRESNPDAYTPKMVSIGPYHKKNPQLDSMEKYKLLYLRRFLQRNEKLDVECCINELEKLKEEALKCYADVGDSDNDSHEFCRMLLLDGCFAVEFIRECSEMCPPVEEKIINIDDVICYQIVRDLMLLENQLPFFVLNKLFHMTKQDDELPLAILANDTFNYFGDMPKLTHASIIKEIECNAGNIKHLLHVVHIFSCHGNPMKKSKFGIMWHKIMPNATKLSEAGVRFAKVGYATNLFDIKFENGLMTIPYFQVEDGTETLLQNLIAYEQQSSDVQPKYFSDFATFMDYLIDSDADVTLLRQEGIIENWIGDDKEVASMFNKMRNKVRVYSNFYYNEEYINAVEHCEKPWNKMRAKVMHNFFNKAWAGASTVAAIIVFTLTIIQTILAFVGGVR